MRLFAAIRPSTQALEHLDSALHEVRADAGLSLRWTEERPPDPSQLALSRAVHALSVYRGPSWEAEEVELLSSHLGQGRSGGPRHELLGSVPLGG
ncbi:2'-5' RNA ligase family protein [Brachybacterium massiliense]|uniref:2'-5' RNA ligase family protein n=1 Tax=Brachybacterium massiliense TaxID=1755098 RepID=UPI000B3BB26E|nr:hypothetical protein [Brachybacterium massiliense]